MKKIGVLGGTFDPIHNGHIHVAQKALKLFDLDIIAFVPTGIPPHKDPRSISDKKHRAAMVLAAIKGVNKFKLSRIEMNRKGYSYAVDTFKKLKKRFGSDSQLYYIMGLDSINTILDWKKPLELFRLCRFLIATRPGAKMKTFKRIMKFPPVSMNKEGIEIFEMKWDVSSTEIRKKVREGKSISRLVPAPVRRYIQKTGLYKEKK